MNRTLLIFAIFLFAQATAAVPEPDVVFYGHVTRSPLNTACVPAGMAWSLSGNAETLAVSQTTLVSVNGETLTLTRIPFETRQPADNTPLPATRGGNPSRRGDLDERIACIEETASLREVRGEELLQSGFGGIAARQPKNLRRRPELNLEMDEIAVLGNDHRARLCGSRVNRPIVGIPEAGIAHRQGGDSESGREPAGQPRRKLRVEPDGHAASTGWSTRRLAYATQARMSSDSKSGISSRICAAVSPEASRSSTSLTRMRIPRTQGRPPHWAGLAVMRWSSSGMVERRDGTKIATVTTTARAVLPT